MTFRSTYAGRDLRREVRLALGLDVAGRRQERRGLPLGDDRGRHGFDPRRAKGPAAEEVGRHSRRHDDDRPKQQPTLGRPGTLGLPVDAEGRQVGGFGGFLAHGLEIRAAILVRSLCGTPDGSQAVFSGEVATVLAPGGVPGRPAC